VGVIVVGSPQLESHQAGRAFGGGGGGGGIFERPGHGPAAVATSLSVAVA
jgi:hypothetical protein